MPERVTVASGDCIFSLAFERGFFPETIWSDPANASLKELRVDPSVLLPGDVVVIPDKQPKQLRAATGARHRFRRRGVPKFLRIRLVGSGVPLANREVSIAVDGAAPRAAVTDGDGWLEHGIAPNSRVAVVQLNERTTYRLQLGMLDPVDTESGVQGRLQLLGLYDGPIGEATPETAEALRRFQRANGLTATGESDVDTRKKLLAVAGA